MLLHSKTTVQLQNGSHCYTEREYFVSNVSIPGQAVIQLQRRRIGQRSTLCSNNKCNKTESGRRRIAVNLSIVLHQCLYSCATCSQQSSEVPSLVCPPQSQFLLWPIITKSNVNGYCAPMEQKTTIVFYPNNV